MGIFSNFYNLTESTVNVPTGDVYMAPTMESSDAAILEFADSLYKITAGLYIADSIMETRSVTESSYDATPVLEATAKEIFQKIKAALINFWNKVKAWFKAVIDQIKALFMSGEKFVKTYATQIKEKASKNKSYKYKGYGYSIAKLDGAVNSIRDKANKSSEKISSLPDFVSKLPKDSDEKVTASTLSTLWRNHFDTILCSDDSETIYKDITGEKNLSDMAEELAKIGRKGDVTKADIIGFSENSVDEMIKFIEGYKNAISSINKDADTTDSTFNKLINAYDKTAKVVASKDSATAPGLTALVNATTTNVKTLLAIAQRASSVKTTIYKEAYRTYVGALKGVFRTKTVKESYDGDDTSGESLLESAMNLI